MADIPTGEPFHVRPFSIKEIRQRGSAFADVPDYKTLYEGAQRVIRALLIAGFVLTPFAVLGDIQIWRWALS